MFASESLSVSSLVIVMFVSDGVGTYYYLGCELPRDISFVMNIHCGYFFVCHDHEL